MTNQFNTWDSQWLHHAATQPCDYLVNESSEQRETHFVEVAGINEYQMGLLLLR